MASTLLTLVQNAMMEMGLPSPTSVVGNTNVDVTQVLALMNASGNEIARQYQWQALTKEYRFTTVFYTYTGDLTDDSFSVTNMSSTSGLNSNFMVTGTGINQDTYVSTVTGPSYALLDGTAGYLSTPDSAAVSITGDLSILARISLDDWTPTSQIDVVSKGTTTPTNFSFDNSIGATNGYMRWSASNNGSSFISVSNSGVAPGFTDGTAHWLLWTADVNTGAGVSAFKYYTAADSSTIPALSDFTQLGSTATPVVPSFFDSSVQVLIGAGWDSGAAWHFLAGKVYRVLIYNGLYGGTATLAADFNALDGTAGATSVTSSTTGETWTLNGTASLPAGASTSVTLTQAASASGTAVSLTFSQTKYNMPSDFDRLVDATDWDKSKHWQQLGPETAQQWQWLKSGYISTGPRVRFRVLGGQFQIWPPLGAADYMGFEYISNQWVSSASAQSNMTAPDQTSFQADTDKCVFPDRLMINAVKLKYFEIKSFDTTALWRDYNMQLEIAKSQDAGSPDLSMSPKPGTQLIGWGNIPDSGFGT